MSLLGTKIKPFKANAYRKGSFIEVTEKDLEGKWSVVVFYPADFTSVCNSELEDLQSNYETLKSLGAEIYSVSADTHYTHQAWHESTESRSKIAYTMIADPTHTLSRNFDVLDEEGGHAQRATFIIDPDGVVQAIEISATSVGRDSDVIACKIKAAQFVRNNPGGSCPAKWMETNE